MIAQTTTNMSPGEEVNSWCTKCREIRLHKVKAVAPGRVPRVICIVCDGEHNFRPQPPKTKRTKKKTTLNEPNPWKELTENMIDKKTIPYTIHDSFIEGEFVDHQRYGLGVVTEILDSNKLVIAFEDKKRIMVCNK